MLYRDISKHIFLKIGAFPGYCKISQSSVNSSNNDDNARVGGQCVVDPSPEEEECSSASLLVAVTPDGQ